MTDNNNFLFPLNKKMKRRMKDIHVRKRAIKIYMIKIYSNTPNFSPWPNQNGHKKHPFTPQHNTSNSHA